MNDWTLIQYQSNRVPNFVGGRKKKEKRKILKKKNCSFTCYMKVTWFWPFSFIYLLAKIVNKSKASLFVQKSCVMVTNTKKIWWKELHNFTSAVCMILNILMGLNTPTFFSTEITFVLLIFFFLTNLFFFN